MLATLIVVLREVLEASLIVGILVAATRGVPHRLRWISGGGALGVLGAVIVAAFAARISSWLDGYGQEMFNAVVLFAAVLMLAWHNIWMSRHGRAMAQEAKALGKAVTAGQRTLLALALVCAMALLREGSEVVLFLYGIYLSGEHDLVHMALGSLLGLAAGVALGFGLYRGLVAIPMRHLFSATSMLLLLLTAGLAAQGAAFLAAADVLPSLGENLWDSSRLLSESSLPGQVLHVLTGYTARPEGIQLVFYLTTLALVGLGMYLARPRVRA